MNPRTLARLALAVPLACSASALAWNGPGHETVALIAWDQLTPPQRQALVDVLKAHPRYEKDLMQNLAAGEDPGEHAFLEAATWPDQVKSPVNPLERTEDHKPWHYVDFPYDRDGKHGPVPPAAWDGQGVPADLLQAMQLVTAQLRDPSTALPRKAIDLCWVEHLVGDAHQPLHAVSEYSNAFPDGDQGGNAQHVCTLENPNSNLHSLWDGIEGQSFDPAAIRRAASRIEAAHPRSAEATPAAVLDPRAWVMGSFDAAKRSVYLDGKFNGVTRDQADQNADAIPTLPAGYERQARATADTQMALAGYRLAGLLQSLPESHDGGGTTTGPATMPTTAPAPAN